MNIRSAKPKDLPAITDIYNEVVANSTAIYRDTLTTLEERTEWWQAQGKKGYAILVAEEEGRVLGFASYSDFRTWPGYRFTVEGSIHLAPEARRHGTGTLLVRALIDHARKMGKHMLIAGVDSENAASIRFLEKMGAQRAAYLKEVGYKFGRYLDLVLFQIPLS